MEIVERISADIAWLRTDLLHKLRSHISTSSYLNLPPVGLHHLRGKSSQISLDTSVLTLYLDSPG